MPNRRHRLPFLFALIGLLMAACASQEQPSPDDNWNRTTGAPVDSETQAYLQDAVAAYEDRLPLRIHEQGELVGLETYGNVLDFTFRFSNLKKNGSGNDQQLMKQIMTSVIGIVGCKNPQITDWLDKGVVFRYRFLDDSGGVFAEKDLEEETCA